MRVAFLIAVLSLLNFHHPIAQQTTSASPQAGQILQQALAALNGTDVTGDFCTSGSEREFTLEGSWYANEEAQAGTDCFPAATD